VLQLPPIEIDGMIFHGINIEIKSIIEATGSGLVLSPAALQMVAPGTGLLILGALAILVLLGLIVLFLLKGSKYLRLWVLKLKYKKLIFSMKVTGNRLYRAVLKEMNGREILDYLSKSFRIFLSSLARENCLAMTAGELENLPQFSLSNTDAGVSVGSYLGIFFRKSDELRFSGQSVKGSDILPLLADLKSFLEKLEKKELYEFWV